MKTNDHTSTILIATADRGDLSNKAIFDKRLSRNQLGLLMFLYNQPKKHAPVQEVIERFGIERTTWHRAFKELINLGYGRYIRTSQGQNKIDHTYIITDDPEYLAQLYPLLHDAKMQHEDPHVAKMQHEESEATPEVEENLHVAKMQHRIDQDPYISLNSPRMRRQMKWIDPATTSQEELELRQFYASLGFPLTDDPWHWQEAQKPGFIAWAQITRQFPGWNKAAIINSKLGTKPNEDALRKAYEEWIFTGFNPGNLRGIFEWYAKLCKDKDAEPWNEFFNKRTNRSDTNGTNKKTGRNGKAVHGIATVEYNPSDFTTI